MKILVVEDEPAIQRVIRRGLEAAGFRVDCADDGRRGLDLALLNAYSAVVLDVMLPVMDGWSVCKELRRRKNQVPILMLTARGDVEDRVRGLDLGADDYLSKPFDFAELLARLRALTRRESVNRSRIIRVADLEVDTASRRVCRAGVEIVLSRREYDLLEALAANEGQVLTRELILDNVWADDDTFSNTVDVYIGFLRKKIDAGHAERLIHTVRGFGYTLRRPAEEGSPG
ncbi:MAG TPA: response regulator transcription factor [Armatimonadota bacterium]|jgi:two-component system copper resistance phosphate regulon response regulator CusR